MKKWLVFGFSNCKDPRREAEFVQWYTQVRQPDLIKGGPIRAARLYKNARRSGEQPAFLSVYEVEADELAPAISYLRRETVRLDRMGRGSELLDLGEGGIYEEISSIAGPA
ncbi:MAG: hypothetical protein AB1597_01670 [Chloroflexota bacterium]